MENWETDVDARHECMLLFIETDRPEFSPRLQGNLTWNKCGLSLALLGGNLLSEP